MPPRPSQGARPPAARPAGPPGGPQQIAAAHISTIGVRRPGIGVGGRKIKVTTNHFHCDIPDGIIHHYDVVIGSNADKVLPARLNMEIITILQTQVAPQVFTPRVVYDGRKNIFAPQALHFGRAAEFTVPVSSPNPTPGRPPKDYKVRLTKVAEINPEVLRRYLEGKQSHENVVLTAITALNVVIRMDPSIKYPFNVRSFFTPKETKPIGSGIVLWRGYFQSVRPAVGRMLINVDISTGTMYKPGPLYALCLEVLERPPNQPQALYQGNLPERERIKLQRFISGMRVTVITDPSRSPRVVRKVLTTSAASTTFRTREGGSMTVQNYFRTTYNRNLQHVNAVCVEIGTGAVIPLELCDVPPGQILKKTVPPSRTKDVLEFATKKPHERLDSIKRGLEVLSYGQSEYVRHFQMSVKPEALKCDARVLAPPTLLYGRGSKQPKITPRDGSWNMVDKKFYRPAGIKTWMVIIYEREQRFNRDAVQDMLRGLRASCSDVGMSGFDAEPVVKWENGQGRIAEQMKAAGLEVKNRFGQPPSLIIAVLPEGATDIYTAIKHFGDCTTGVATQCLKSSKCFRAKPQYYANVCLKMNVKLGGINTIPEASSVTVLTDPSNPTIVMGADVIHPAPGLDGRPSFTSLVGNVDSDTSKYIATTRVQASRQEMIEDLREMAQHILVMYGKYRQNVEKRSPFPKRIIFYRDGVSEGQFQTVLDQEVPRLKEACLAAGMNAATMPKISVIVVGKRHHVRLFPNDSKDQDRSGNCPSGTVVDVDIVHPTEFDFYLQSHGGLLGTSRPAHYNVLLDENRFTPDQLQQLSFALCHVYARSTRAVSIPAPVYYADIVCSRARNHYDPTAGLDFSEEQTGMPSGQQDAQLQRFKAGFKPLHSGAAMTMYFS